MTKKLIKPEFKTQTGFCVPIFGLQYGDEGKGKIVDSYSANFSVIARSGGGPNAGHSLKVNGQTVVLNTYPCGAFTDKINLIGPGVVINPILLKEEIEKVIAHGGDPKNKLLISNKCALILPTHKLLDRAEEESKGAGKIGSTQNGITPVYRDFIGRVVVRTCDMFSPDFKEKVEKLVALHTKDFEKLNFTIDHKELSDSFISFYEAVEYLKQYKYISAEYFLNEQLNVGKNILAEGAQASMLDLMFGTYPFVTSSRTIASAVPSTLGIPAHCVENSIGICKLYSTRVGGGPFTTQAEDKVAELIRTAGGEFGARTGRARGIGWLDLVELKYAIMINGATSIIITKADILDVLGENNEKIKICTHYIVDGIKTDIMPDNLLQHKVEPVYAEFVPWKDAKVTGAKSFDELPVECQNILQFIQDKISVPIEGISVGPERGDYFTV